MRETIVVERDCVVNKDQLLALGGLVVAVQLILEAQRYTPF